MLVVRSRKLEYQVYNPVEWRFISDRMFKLCSNIGANLQILKAALLGSSFFLPSSSERTPSFWNRQNFDCEKKYTYTYTVRGTKQTYRKLRMRDWKKKNKQKKSPLEAMQKLLSQQFLQDYSPHSSLKLSTFHLYVPRIYIFLRSSDLFIKI